MNNLIEKIIAEDYKREAAYWKYKYELLIGFIERTEALTKDPDTASRIKTLLNKLEVWDNGEKE